MHRGRARRPRRCICWCVCERSLRPEKTQIVACPLLVYLAGRTGISREGPGRGSRLSPYIPTCCRMQRDGRGWPMRDLKSAGPQALGGSSPSSSANSLARELQQPCSPHPSCCAVPESVRSGRRDSRAESADVSVECFGLFHVAHVRCSRSPCLPRDQRLSLRPCPHRVRISFYSSGCAHCPGLAGEPFIARYLTITIFRVRLASAVSIRTKYTPDPSLGSLPALRACRTSPARG